MDDTFQSIDKVGDDFKSMQRWHGVGYGIQKLHPTVLWSWIWKKLGCDDDDDIFKTR